MFPRVPLAQHPGLRSGLQNLKDSKLLFPGWIDCPCVCVENSRSISQRQGGTCLAPGASPIRHSKTLIMEDHGEPHDGIH